MADRSDTLLSEAVVNSNESVFLEEIAAAPRSSERRLIYADWLEEQGDPRGEFIHLKHEIAAFQPWTIEFQNTSRRLRELRQRIDDQWLQRLAYTTQYRPMLGEIPADRSSRWRLLTAFLEAWHRPLNDSDRIPESVIKSCEYSMEQPLPAALTEWYRHSGYADDIWTRRSPTGFEGTLRQPTDLWPYREQDRMAIGGIPGGAREYALRVTELGMDDPPVYFQASDLAPTGLSVSEFALYRALVMTVRESTKSPGWSARVDNPMRYVPSEFETTAFEAVPHPSGETGFYEAPDALVEVRPASLCITALNVKAAVPVFVHFPRERLRLRVNGQWRETRDERRYVPGVSDPDLLEE